LSSNSEVIGNRFANFLIVSLHKDKQELHLRQSVLGKTLTSTNTHVTKRISNEFDAGLEHNTCNTRR
jgi:hypothetical protein